MPIGRNILAGGICGLVAALACGCGSGASFPFERDVVWRAVVGETIVWRPTNIDDGNYTIAGHMQDATGQEIRYGIEVDRDPNPFVRRPSTRVFIMATVTQSKKEIRLVDLEVEMLSRIGRRLQEEYRSTTSP